MIHLILPYPISSNRYWRSFAIKRKGATHHSPVVTVTDEAKAYKSEVGWLAKAAGCRAPLRCAVQLEILLVPKNGICMDLDNCLKVAIDALNGVAYFDDDQVRKIIAERAEPDGRARLEITITPYEPPAPALFREEQHGEVHSSA